jgi:hypothetical protein
LSGRWIDLVREARDCHAFTSNRREECAQMPARIARLATRPSFWIPEVSVAVRSSRPSCSTAEKTRLFMADRQSSGESRL